VGAGLVTVRIAFLGDTLLGGDAQSVLDERGYGYALEGVAPLLAEADLVVANQEGPITARGEPEEKADTGRKRYWYRALPASADALAHAGVGVASLANNHVLDFGPAGLSDTIEALTDAGISCCGAGTDEAEARQPAIVTLGGLRVGFLSVMQRYHLYVGERLYASHSRPGPLRLRTAGIQEDLARLEGTVDLRVVLVHWGRNYRAVSPRQERWAAVLRAAGADLVVGHHPHIPQRVDVVAGAPVLFSLGNGILGTRGRFHSGRPPFGMVATVDVDDDARVSAVRLQLISVDNERVMFRPVPARGRDAARLLESLVEPGIAARAGEKGTLSIELGRERHGSGRSVGAGQPTLSE
jgi:poly-gamma-glutamate synthesis protein (capsule biosynthesis protein)